MAEGTETFIWIPSSEPRRYGGAFAALATILVVCACVVGNSLMLGFVDAFSRKGTGAERSTAGERPIVAEPAQIDRTSLDHSRGEHREASEPVLMLSSHSKAGMPAKRQGGPKLSQLSGEPMRRLQARVGVQADGGFGASTVKALKAWQGKNGLAADGVAGPDTLMLMGLHDLVLLKRRAHGDAVKKLQEELAVGADGQFGPRTEKAVRDYQKKNGLVVDGRAGPATLAHIKLFKELTADTATVSPGSARP